MDTKTLKYKKPLIFTATFLILIGLFFSGSAFITEKPISSTIKGYLFAPGNTSSPEKGLLQGEAEDRINVLLLGVGGKSHEGSDLTDTIIVGSYKPSEKKIAMMSLPRDLVVYLPDYAWRKINHVHFFAEKDHPGEGVERTADFISDMLDIPIHYYAKVNFNGFTQIVDELGNLEVSVENTLSDKKYPIPGKENAIPASLRYEHLYVEKGVQEMDGELALKYARSRHAQGIEGSDYARSRRQQKILMAMKDKALSLETLLSPTRIKNLFEIVDQNINTNVKIWEIYRLLQLAKNFEKDNLINQVIDSSPEGPLIENNYNGAFVLETKTGNFDELKFLSKHIFETDREFDYEKREFVSNIPLNDNEPDENVTRDENATSLGNTSIPRYTATIEIRNGTLINGLAGDTKEKLENLNLEISKIGNAKKQNRKTTVIYDLTPETVKTNTIEVLESNLSENIETQVPEDLDIPKNTDFLILLGPDIFY